MWLQTLKRAAEAMPPQQPSPKRALKRRHTPVTEPDPEFEVSGNDIKNCCILQRLLAHAVATVIKRYGRPTCGRRTITVGSLCTGSAGDAVALDELEQALQAEDIDIIFRHAFFCEIDKRKRDVWCKEVHQVLQGVDDPMELPCAFDDCETLGTSKATCTMHQQAGKPCGLPDALDLLTAGFICKDLSNANSNKANLKGADIFKAKETQEALHKPCMPYCGSSKWFPCMP